MEGLELDDAWDAAGDLAILARSLCQSLRNGHATPDPGDRFAHLVADLYRVAEAVPVNDTDASLNEMETVSAVDSWLRQAAADLAEVAVRLGQSPSAVLPYAEPGPRVVSWGQVTRALT